jgi:hypothetical protein
MVERFCGGWWTLGLAARWLDVLRASIRAKSQRSMVNPWSSGESDGTLGLSQSFDEK